MMNIINRDMEEDHLDKESIASMIWNASYLITDFNSAIFI